MSCRVVPAVARFGEDFADRRRELEAVPEQGEATTICGAPAGIDDEIPVGPSCVDASLGLIGVQFAAGRCSATQRE